jgi:hypothetical protein
MKSQAPQVVVNREAREALARMNPAAFARTQDRLEHKDVSSLVVSEETSTEQAIEAITRALTGAEVSFSDAFDVAATAGLKSGAASAAGTLLFETVERIARGQPIDGGVIRAAVIAGVHSTASTTLQTYAQVQTYLGAAKSVFEAKILRAVAENSAWAGAVAEIVVRTGLDVVEWIQKKISFETLLRRTGVVACGATAGAIAATIMTRATAGAHPLLRILLVALAGIAGQKLGVHFGAQLFLPLNVSASTGT